MQWSIRFYKANNYSNYDFFSSRVKSKIGDEQSKATLLTSTLLFRQFIF